MNRTSLAVLSLLIAVAVGWLTIQDRDRGTQPVEPPRRPSPPPVAVLDAGVEPDAGDVGDAGLVDDTESDAGGTLLDGGRVPDLELGSPASVLFGVVLVRYAGAEGAAASTRSRSEAMLVAAELAELAATDFEAAVKKGDKGSDANAGRMFRDILEPAPEFVLFSLGKGEVSGPVETPSGFWILKRLE